MRSDREVGGVSTPSARERAMGVRPMTAVAARRSQVADSSPVRHVAWMPAAELGVREWAEAGRRMGSVGTSSGSWVTGSPMAIRNSASDTRVRRRSPGTTLRP